MKKSLWDPPGIEPGTFVRHSKKMEKFTLVTWEKLESDVDKFYLRRGENKYRNKILFLCKLSLFD